MKHKLNKWLEDARLWSAFYVCFCIVLVLLGIMTFLIFGAAMGRML